MKSTPDRAKTTMKHILAMNKNPTGGMKNNNQPPRGVSNVTAFAKGGKVKAKVVYGDGKTATKADCAPMKKGGKVKKVAAGGAAKLRRKSPMPKPVKKVPYVNGG